MSVKRLPPDWLACVAGAERMNQGSSASSDRWNWRSRAKGFASQVVLTPSVKPRLATGSAVSNSLLQPYCGAAAEVHGWTVLSAKGLFAHSISSWLMG